MEPLVEYFDSHIDDVMVSAVCEWHDHVLRETVPETAGVTEVFGLFKSRIGELLKVENIGMSLSDLTEGRKASSVFFLLLKSALLHRFVLEVVEFFDRPVSD